jgi:glycosyltransferase involved in cell wall biosynthesis
VKIVNSGIKVIFVLHSHKSGGAERHLLQLMSGLAASGIECIYAGPRDSWLAEQLSGSGFRCEHIPYHGIYDLVSLIRLVRLIKRENADIIHGHLTRGALYAGWAGLLAGVPNVATAHSTNAGKHFGRARRVIAVSHAVAHFLAECGYAKDRICTVHNGVPDYASAPDSAIVKRLESLRKDDVPIITMVARLEQVKGHDIAFRALAKLTNFQWSLVLAGALDTPWAAQMQKLANELKIMDRIEFVGHIDQVASIYAITNILIAPSRREAFSLTLLEAASFALPIVASRVGGNSEAVIDQETGILIESENVDELASAIEILLGSMDTRLTMGRNARKQYEDNFSDHTMINKTIAVYRQLIKGV